MRVDDEAAQGLRVEIGRLLGHDVARLRDRRDRGDRGPLEQERRIDAGSGADAAFLLEPTPVSAIVAVARAGDVMPQKSTYFYPKALTGLVINPHEW